MENVQDRKFLVQLIQIIKVMVKEKRMKEKERKQNIEVGRKHDSDQTDSIVMTLSQLVLQELYQINVSLAMIHNLTVMKHFHGSDVVSG